MNLLEEHIAYLKDNPEGYWFKRKLYGVGWTPARRAGWVTLGVYVAFVLGVVFLATGVGDEIAALALPALISSTILFLAIVVRTGESLKWQWGNKDEQEK